MSLIKSTLHKGLKTEIRNFKMKTIKQSRICFTILAFLSFLLLNFAEAKTKDSNYEPEEGSEAEKRGLKHQDIKIDPKLPNVLILGDSISLGYLTEVRRLLTGKANVIHPPTNCEGTTFGVEKIDEWLSGPKWTLIHFNWGLHDLKHVPDAGEKGKSDNPQDPLQATVDQYSKNMVVLLNKLQATGAKLIFATTTPVAPGTTHPLREPESVLKYNEAALKLMKERGIKINDLYGFILPQLNTLQRAKNVHFNAEGSKALGGQVAKSIEEELMKAQ